MNQETPLIDWARPMLDIEKQLRTMQDLCLQRSYLEANALTAEVIANLRILQASLAILAEKERRSVE